MRKKSIIVQTWRATLFLGWAMSEVVSFKTGGPNRQDVCADLTPLHDSAVPQRSSPPFTIEVEGRSFIGGQNIKVTLRGLKSGDEFKGFFIQARREVGGEKTKFPVGNFTGSGDGWQKLTCVSNHDTVTHSDGEDKTSVLLQWIAPNFEGNYFFIATFVKNYQSFWARVPSRVFHVEEIFDRDLKPKGSHATLRDIYSKCGDGKDCFGIPHGCVEGFKKSSSNEPCEIVTSYSKTSDEQYAFQVAGKTHTYLAVGLSHDHLMNNDSVIGCSVDPLSSKITISSYYNTQFENKAHQDLNFGLDPSKSSGSFENGFLFCEFSRKRYANLVNEIGINFDLEKKYHILLSKGSFVSRRGLGKHDGTSSRGGTRNPIEFNAYRSDSNNAPTQAITIFLTYFPMLILKWIV